MFFSLEKAPAFLTEELALHYAQEAMKLDGYSLEEWKPMEDHRGISMAALMGSRDRYFFAQWGQSQRGRCGVYQPRGEGATSSGGQCGDSREGKIFCQEYLSE